MAKTFVKKQKTRNMIKSKGLGKKLETRKSKAGVLRRPGGVATQ